AELRGELIREFAGLADMCAGLEQNDDRESGRPIERPEAPAVARPDVFLVGRRATRAVDAALTDSRRLALHRRPQRPRAHGPPPSTRCAAGKAVPSARKDGRTIPVGVCAFSPARRWMPT